MLPIWCEYPYYIIYKNPKIQCTQLWKWTVITRLVNDTSQVWIWGRSTLLSLPVSITSQTQVELRLESILSSLQMYALFISILKVDDILDLSIAFDSF